MISSIIETLYYHGNITDGFNSSLQDAFSEMQEFNNKIEQMRTEVNNKMEPITGKIKF